MRHRPRRNRGKKLKVVRTPDLEFRFMCYVDRKGHSGCWLWVGSRATAKAYGRFYCDGKVHWAHRVSYALFKAPIPKGFDVHHTCDNVSCVNPTHLEIADPDTHRRYQDLDKYCPPHEHPMVPRRDDVPF